MHRGLMTKAKPHPDYDRDKGLDETRVFHPDMCRDGAAHPSRCQYYADEGGRWD